MLRFYWHGSNRNNHYNFEKSVIEDDYRINLGENAKSSGTDKLRYAFKITPK